MRKRNPLTIIQTRCEFIRCNIPEVACLRSCGFRPNRRASDRPIATSTHLFELNDMSYSCARCHAEFHRSLKLSESEQASVSVICFWPSGANHSVAITKAQLSLFLRYSILLDQHTPTWALSYVEMCRRQDFTGLTDFTSRAEFGCTICWILFNSKLTQHKLSWCFSVRYLFLN